MNFNKHIFYNVNSEFYIWADSWEEIVDGVRANNDRIGWPTMDESELPSFFFYSTPCQRESGVHSGARRVSQEQITN